MPRTATLERTASTMERSWELPVLADGGPDMETRIFARLGTLLNHMGIRWPDQELRQVAAEMANASEGTVEDVSEHYRELDWHWEHPSADMEVLGITMKHTRS